VYTIPIGVIQAITNQQVGLNVITELIIGYALPGRPIAMMLFKTWGYITMVQALQFTSDFKLGHYMKLAHRPMFFCQVVATIVAGTVQLGVQAWMFSNIEDLCSPEQKDGFICPSTTVFGTASIIVSLFVVAAHTFSVLVAQQPVVVVFYSGVSLDHSVCSRRVSSTMASSFSSSLGPLHRLYSGLCTRSSGSNSSSTSTSRSSSPARVACPPRRRSTTFPGCLSAICSTMSSAGDTLAGGPSTTVSFVFLGWNVFLFFF
jgi:OPT oligopeptide transporter protein